MTYPRHNRGKRYTEYEGPTWSIALFVLTGIVFGQLKARPVYKGTKEDMKRRQAKAKRHK